MAHLKTNSFLTDLTLGKDPKVRAGLHVIVHLLGFTSLATWSAAGPLRGHMGCSLEFLLQANLPKHEGGWVGPKAAVHIGDMLAVGAAGSASEGLCACHCLHELFK